MTASIYPFFSCLTFFICFSVHNSCRLLPFNSAINPGISCCVTYYFALLIIINQITYKQASQFKRKGQNKLVLFFPVSFFLSLVSSFRLGLKLKGGHLKKNFQILFPPVIVLLGSQCFFLKIKILLVGQCFLVDIVKNFSVSKKSFLWSRWSLAEGQLIFSFRFYGPNILLRF